MNLKKSAYALVTALGISACVTQEGGKDTGCPNVNAELKEWEKCVKAAAACEQEETKEAVDTCLGVLAKQNPAYKPDDNSCVMECES